jgi:hypothetical protein
MSKALNSARRTSRVVTLVSSTVILGWLTAQSLKPQSTYREVARATLQSFQGCPVPLRSPAGDLWCVESGGMSVSRYSAAGALLSRIRIDSVPEAKTGKVTFLQDVAVDNKNNLYVSGIWRNQPRSFASGIFVFDPAGAYVRTVALSPAIELRHAAVDSQGNIYGLGVDGDFVRRRTDYCLLVHKYSPDGKRLTAFSSCPAGLMLRTPAGTPGPDFMKLPGDVDKGRLWIAGDRVYHLMASSHILRVFDPAGKQLQALEFAVPPAPGPTGSLSPIASVSDVATRVLPLAGGRYMVEWQHTEMSENTRHSSRYWAMHGATGKAMSDSAPPPLFTVLLSADEAGDCYALSASGTSAGRPTGLDLIRLRMGEP